MSAAGPLPRRSHRSPQGEGTPVSTSTFLGLDAGGTSTRWALADASGTLLHEGAVAGLTALMMGNAGGRLQAHAVLSELARNLTMQGMAAPGHLLLGITGFSEDASLRRQLQALLCELFRLQHHAITILADVELAYYAAFAPGAGYLVSAGTGSIGAYVDSQHTFHRVGGRGSLLGDPGSGHWIACEAMRTIWRREDEQPGCWRDSPLAQSVFARVGGNDWAQSRDFIYQGSRGEVGTLALAVAAAADTDAIAADILERAGTQLAQLANTFTRRFGPKPVVFAGRVLELHPRIGKAARANLPAGTPSRCATLLAHHAAARLAAQAHHNAASPRQGGAT